MIDEVIVGIDDSPSGRFALHWAAHHARNTHILKLRTIHVITPTMYGPLSWSVGYAGMATIPDPNIKEELRAQVDSIYQSIRPEPNWRIQYEESSAGPVLTCESKAAQLLNSTNVHHRRVIGTQEHTGIGRTITGSASHYCLSHAHCPVVAVSATEPPREASEGRS